MRRFVTLLATLLLLTSTAYGQDRYYYSDERKIPIEQYEKWKVVQISENAKSALTSTLSRRSDIRLRRALNPERGFYWLEAEGPQAVDSATLDQLSKQVSIRRTIPVFLREQRGDTTHFVMTDEFRVKFKPNVSRAQIDALNERHGVEMFLKNDQDRQQARDYNEYLLHVTEASALNALEAANRYYEKALTAWSVPNFLVNYRLHRTRENTSTRVVAVTSQSVNDPLYDEQYYLNNTSSNLGSEDIDIDAPEAWNHTKGSSSITVAVFDDGVEQHEDLYGGQLVTGYTGGGGDGSPATTSDHGQVVTGIIAANHNSKGVRGVAPSVKIMPIKIFEPLVNDNQIENAIDYAWQNEADVLNNSWGGGPPDAGIEAAIQRARQNGRNGKGSVVVFTAGNTADSENGYDGYVTFPATVDGVLAVGSVTRDGNPANYTPKNDPEVDIIAPSSDHIPAPPNGDVRTMDRMSSSGYNATDYEDSFGGTSAATPQASGVAALMLSLESHLSESEVRQIIRDEAVDYGSSDWSGDGLINAKQAVVEAARPSAPTGLTVVNEGSGTPSNLVNPKLDWNDNPEPDLSHYEVYRKRASEYGFTHLASPTNSEYTDTGSNLNPNGEKITYKVETVDNGGYASPSSLVSTNGDDMFQLRAGSMPETLPDTVAVSGNAPNPVRDRTTIRYALPKTTDVTLSVYDMMGRRVATLVKGTRPAGHHEVQVDSRQLSGLPSGVYLYRLQAGSFTETKQMVVVR